ncbi:hypothetical protein HYQ45_010561 [Verticillium longisporum]|uniref:Bud22 domain-containing protein n=1 Tax=Verticillium longisporum TaxID=100787 RepID=A0A0G4LPS9_VERLO|nr:hypothetical protein HYQ44_020119 [Verticillium longisporum]KAG7130691.1 hypothetical protein HYQ45_010561 [Verticillium longisporum]CRK12819.1 hypothetical protein BN1708_010620 [Verticillium longisporum]CRK23956.1 hypothetical protein BN1723_003095 [Verticillium longisporum]
MPKRKRSVDEELDEKLTELKQELFRALKAAKGLERQRLSKRIHEAKSSPDKVERLNREVTALKTIDLQETAHAHLASSLTKIKAIAEHPALPDDYKEGPPKKELSEQDKLALHNVTSGLYSRPAVREVAEKAIQIICMTLDVPMPEKRARGKKGEKNKEANAKSEDEAQTKMKSTAGTATAPDPPAKKRRVADEPADDAASVSDSFNGFSDNEDDDQDAGDIGEDDEEAALSKMADMLGNSDDEEEDVEAMRAKYSALLGQQPDTEDADDESDDVDDLDGLEEMDEDEDEAEEEESEEEQDDQQDMNSERRKMLEAVASRPPAPARQPKEPKPVKAGATTFLPSLMGGYFSGSESASDVDVAPPKKRLGQRQRQAIAERKHGELANHMRNEKKKKQGGRDDGWDMKRGAVDSAEGKGRKPWMKEGGKEKEGGKGGRAAKPVMNRKERRRLKLLSKDDQGELHPSWQARKKEKEALQSAAFQGTKITF